MIDHQSGRLRMQRVEQIRRANKGVGRPILNSLMDQRLLGAQEAMRYCLTGESRDLDNWIRDSLHRIRIKHAAGGRECDCDVCRDFDIWRG